jgi:hypothetical protein
MTKNKSIGGAAEFGKIFYDGAAEFGDIEAWIGAIFATVIGLVLFIIGIVDVSRKTSLTNTVEGKITKANCGVPYQSDNQQLYNCTIDIEYTVDNKKYSISISKTDNFQQIEGQTINVYYNPSTPEKGAIQSDNSKTVGIIFIGAGLLIPAFAWLWLWIAYKSKFAAAAGGVAGAINLFKN